VFCTKCGAPAPGNRCESCGAALANLVPSSVLSRPQEQPDHSSSRQVTQPVQNLRRSCVIGYPVGAFAAWLAFHLFSHPEVLPNLTRVLTRATVAIPIAGFGRWFKLTSFVTD
jgi:hypothetical protein